MNCLSVVIITLNEEKNITDCIKSAKRVSDDIIIVDCGSSDNTVSLAVNEGARVYSKEWTGYGNSRNYGAAQARHNWILSLDADERISSQLIASLPELNHVSPYAVFKFKRRNYIGNKQIRFGTPGFETVLRIYNREKCQWDHSLVHENLSTSKKNAILLKGYIDHYSFRSYSDQKAKARHYAVLGAEKYYLEGRNASFIKRFGSPVFNSFKSFIIHLGFLDGKKGLMVAGTIAYYSWLKYYYLNERSKQEANSERFLKWRTLPFISFSEK
jgi:glycosyltransferase involved in cell wall biosynthesis